MKFLCLITHTVYGESGTELPPPVQDREVYTEMSHDGESALSFSRRMSDLILPIRKDAESKPARPYSTQDGWDWAIYDVKPLPYPQH